MPSYTKSRNLYTMDVMKAREDWIARVEERQPHIMKLIHLDIERAVKNGLDRVSFQVTGHDAQVLVIRALKMAGYTLSYQVATDDKILSYRDYHKAVEKSLENITYTFVIVIKFFDDNL